MTDWQDTRQSLFSEFHQRAPIPMGRYNACSLISIRLPVTPDPLADTMIERLCAALGQPAPARGAREVFLDGEDHAAKWERHGEFATLTVYADLGPLHPDNPKTAFSHLQDAATLLEGTQWLAAVHVFLLDTNAKDATRTAEGKDTRAPEGWFANDYAAGGLVCDGRAEIWSDFRLGRDGFNRILVCDSGLGPQRAGRLIQRLLDIETYRIAAMQGLSLAHEANQFCTEIEAALHELLEDTSFHSHETPDRSYLDGLLALASRVEHFQSQSSFRFGATRAYSRLVHRRLDDLNEQRIQGAQRMAVFLRRRFVPAVDTCETARERLRDVALRIERDAALIRTRIDLARQEQNNALLDTMNQRADQQFKLESTVEALSTVAISYYAIGLIGVAAKALADVVPGIRASLLTGISAPLVILAVFLFLRTVRHKTLGKD